MKKVKASNRSAVTQPKNQPTLKARKIRKEPPFDGYAQVKIQMPPDLLAWAENQAFQMDYFLSDYLTGLLEGERLNDGRIWISHYRHPEGGAR